MLPLHLNIFIADDDPVFVMLARSCLENEGHNVHCVGDGVAALEMLGARAFDVALIDLAMPQIDGFRLIAMIRSTRKIANLPIIVLSSRNDLGAIQEAFQLGANGFESKPVNWARFPAQLRKVILAQAEAME